MNSTKIGFLSLAVLVSGRVPIGSAKADVPASRSPWRRHGDAARDPLANLGMGRPRRVGPDRPRRSPSHEQGRCLRQVVGEVAVEEGE